MVAPAGAAKGNRPSVQYVEGSYSGTTVSVAHCPFPSGAHVVADVSVRASSLGRGALHYDLEVGLPGGTWRFVASDGKSTISGEAGISFGPGIQVQVHLLVTSGTGKFAGVSAGNLTTYGEIPDSTVPCGVTSMASISGAMAGNLVFNG